jgi:hypothetical protein
LFEGNLNSVAGDHNLANFLFVIEPFTGIIRKHSSYSMVKYQQLLQCSQDRNEEWGNIGIKGNPKFSINNVAPTSLIMI